MSRRRAGDGRQEQVKRPDAQTPSGWQWLVRRRILAPFLLSSSLIVSHFPHLRAQVPARASLKIHSLGVFADQWFVGGGLGLAWRTAARFTAEVTGSVGAQDGEFAARGEALIAFHLDPFRVRGLSPYAGGGVAALVRDGATAEYLVLLVGVESRPGRNRGWFAELGLGGGVRAALGARLRLR